MNDDRSIIVECDPDGVGRITFNRPERRNAFDAAQWDRLGDALKHLASERGLRCLVVSGRERAFAAGGDLATMLSELDADGAARFRERIHRCLNTLYNFPVPTIAKVNGPAIGGGLEVAIACDLRIGARGVKFGMPAARFGMVMARSDFARLATIVGVDRARFMAISAEILDDETALRCGLLHWLVDTAELDNASAKLASRICGIDPAAARWFRQAARALELGESLEPLAPFENTCLDRHEFRNRVQEFLSR